MEGETNDGTNIGVGEESASRKRLKGKRGPTKLPRLFGGDTILSLEWNASDQPVGDNASTFSDAIGVILKVCRRIRWPVEWRKVDPLAKDWIWEQLTANFELDDARREDILKYYVAPIFRYKKTKWKAKYYTRNDTDEVRLLRKPEELSESQWAELVHFWGTPEHQKIAERNKINRGMQEIKHTGGRKSCPRVIHELEVAEGKRPSRGRLFVVNHINKKSNDTLDGKSRNIISEMRALAGVDENGVPQPLTDEHYYKVMPPDGHGRVRGMGAGITPTRYYGSSSRGASTIDREKQMEEEIDRKVQERTTELESRLREKIMEEMRTMIKQLHSSDSFSQSDGSRATESENRSSPNVPPEVSRQAHHMGVVPKRCKLMNWQKLNVAEGRLESMDSNALVHHIPLGLDNWKVWIDVALEPNASLWRSTSEMSTVEQAVGTTVAWHKDYVSLD